MYKNVILTGCNGFIGQYVVATLKQNGYRIIGIDMSANNTCCDVDRFFETNLSATNSIEMLAKELDPAKEYIVIHLAADIHVPGDINTLHNNIDSVHNIVELTKYLKIKQIVYLSSIPVIGKPKYIPITEEHPVEPDTYYHISKYMGELLLKSVASSSMPVAILRIPSPIGRGMRGGNFLSMLLDKCKQDAEIELYGTGSRVQNYIDVRDLSKAIIQAVERKYNGLALIASKKSVSNIEIAKRCILITESKSEVHTGIQEDPDDGLKWDISVSRANKEIGFIPQYSIDESIKWIISY